MVLTDQIVHQGGSSFDQTKNIFQRQESSISSFLTWNLFRLALLSACMLFAILISTVYSLHRASGAPSTRGGWLETKQSPLHHILLRDQTLSDELKYIFTPLCSRIEFSTLQFEDDSTL